MLMYFKTNFVNKLKEQTESTSDLLLNQLDPRNTGKITERAFLSNTRRLYTEKQLRPMLRFELIPYEIVNEVNMQPSVAGKT